ncbi:fibronectin type III domain-containing protein [Constantimarinum furrinae]|uniref:Fibronectin type-III domain-containing protein n=1 Tax=Constantimarinum furrinae TaxID=2562285 RepID=A0A7G8PUE0_9FLAO|nr:fibronectin type III domain-containing protein [Constantimarinum furrinae]QNJ97956.1 hypothetical protein ALE3EI_1394 [Constantimarinum furrinae]
MKNLYFLICLIGAILISACSKDDNYVPVNDDTENPSAPQNLMATTVTETAIQLSWDASADNVGVTGYDIYVDGSIATSGVTGNTGSVTGLDQETTYSIYVIALDAAGNESDSSNVLSATTAAAPLEFKTQLTEMGVYAGGLANLNPASGVQLYEINSTLFTDHAAKQRLIKLPNGSSMEFNNSDLLPNFPNNTLIAKTFYYNVNDQNPSEGKIIIETRILIKQEEGWQVGNYIWNESQTEATLRDTGSTIPISYIDINGTTQNIDYQIPSTQDCFQCHNNTNETFPIGMKLRSMNFVPSYTGQNQLDYFIANGLLTGLSNTSQVSVLPDWQDETNFSLSERARAYIDINCAHCHSPGGSVPPVYNLDLRYETSFGASGIFDAREEIEARFASTIPLYRMPLLGRTIVHEDALQLISDYVDSL